MTTRRKTLLALAMVPVAATLSLGSIGLASAHPADSQATHQVARRTPTIKISSFMFTVPAHVRAGANIRVVNNDGVDHTVTADDGAFDVKVPANSKKTFTAPLEAGSYAFHCAIHLSMKGTLVVR